MAITFERIAQAIGDPGSIVKRQFDADGDPCETITSWSTRAVLTVLAEDLGLPAGPADRDAVAKPNTSGCACQLAALPEPAEGSEDILIAALTRNAATATELVAARQGPAPQGPCNPMIVFDGDDVLLVCDDDGTTIVDLVPTRRWSALVLAVAAHRCTTTSATTPSEANGDDRT